MVTIEELDCQDGAFSKGSSNKRQSYFVSLNKPKRPKTTSVCPNVLLPQIQDKKRLCCIFPGSLLEIKSNWSNIIVEESATLSELKEMRKIFSNVKICAVM